MHVVHGCAVINNVMMAQCSSALLHKVCNVDKGVLMHHHLHTKQC